MPCKDFDYTKMSTFLTCRRKYYYRMERGLVGHVEASAPLFGSAIHKALDVWFKNKDLDEATELFKKTFVEDKEDDKRTHKMGEWILKNYHEKYRDQPFKVLSTEQEFCLPLPNGNNLIGRIDKIIEWDGAVWGMDHKTTSTLGPSYMKMHTPNMQFSGYTWAIQQLGYPNCQGVLVDAILVAKGLLESAGRARLTPLLRDFAYRSPGDIKEYMDTVRTIQHDISLQETLKQWTPNWDACVDYGECAYRRICKEPVEYREKIINNDFIVKHWDPRGSEKKDG